MDTVHHGVSLRVKSVLDACGGDDEAGDEAMEELEGSQQVARGAAGARGSHACMRALTFSANLPHACMRAHGGARRMRACRKVPRWCVRRACATRSMRR